MAKHGGHQGGRPKLHPNDQCAKRVVLMVFAGLSPRYMAEALGMSHETLYRCYKAELETGKDNVIGQVANAQLRLALAWPPKPGTASAQQFILERRAGWASRTKTEVEVVAPETPKQAEASDREAAKAVAFVLETLKQREKDGQSVN